MKAWELIKALEEGKSLERADRITVQMHWNSSEYIRDIYINPHNYKIVTEPIHEYQVLYSDINYLGIKENFLTYMYFIDEEEFYDYHRSKDDSTKFYKLIQETKRERKQ